MNTIKFLKKGLKINNQYFPCRYSSAKNNIKGNATVYLKGYEALPTDALIELGLSVHNDTDLLTDYYDKDKIRISPTSPYFTTIENLAAKP